MPADLSGSDSSARELAVPAAEAVRHAAADRTKPFGGVAQRIAFGQTRPDEGEGDQDYQDDRHEGEKPAHPGRVGPDSIVVRIPSVRAAPG